MPRTKQCEGAERIEHHQLNAFPVDDVQIPTGADEVIGSTESLITVVMPCFNCARFVEAAVASVLTQSWRRVQLIVVDDGSTDGSAEILGRLQGKFGQSMTVLTQLHAGAYAARNRAISVATGDLMAFLDADDLWSRQCLETMARQLAYAHADIVLCGWEDIAEDGACIARYGPPRSHGAALRLLLDRWSWPIHAALVKATAIHTLGGFSERHRTSMDYDLWLRLFAATDKLSHVPVPLAKYRWHGIGQISTKKSDQQRDAAEVLARFLRDNPSICDRIDESTLECPVG